MPSKIMTVDEQIRMLQKLGNPELIQKFAICLALLCCAMLALAYYKHEFFFIMLALMFALVGFASRQTVRNAIWAAKAWRTGYSTAGEVIITVKTDDEGAIYSGVVRDAQHKAWQMQFGKPPGWEPQAGKLAAKLFYVQQAQWPVLIVTATGILVPRTTPKLTI